jgi:hypothetical protein
VFVMMDSSSFGMVAYREHWWEQSAIMIICMWYVIAVKMG